MACRISSTSAREAQSAAPAAHSAREAQSAASAAHSDSEAATPVSIKEDGDANATAAAVPDEEETDWISALTLKVSEVAVKTSAGTEKKVPFACGLFPYIPRSRKLVSIRGPSAWSSGEG